MRRALVLLLLTACGAKAPVPAAAKPSPFHCYTYTWRTGHGSSCFPAPGVCDGHAEEAHSDPVYLSVTGCSPAARAYCYDLGSPTNARLCYASAEDCDAARAEEPGDASGCNVVTDTPAPPRTTPPR